MFEVPQRSFLKGPHTPDKTDPVREGTRYFHSRFTISLRHGASSERNHLEMLSECSKDAGAASHGQCVCLVHASLSQPGQSSAYLGSAAVCLSYRCFFTLLILHCSILTPPPAKVETIARSLGPVPELEAACALDQVHPVHTCWSWG